MLGSLLSITGTLFLSAIVLKAFGYKSFGQLIESVKLKEIKKD